MKYHWKTAIIWAIPLFLAMASLSHAKSYTSDFGYTITVPDDWLIVSKEDVRQQPAVVRAAFDQALKEDDLSRFPQNLWERLKNMVEGGEVEYYYSSKPLFTISVYQGGGNLPSAPSKPDGFCETLPAQLSEEMNAKVNVYSCRSITIDSCPALYIVADDLRRDKKYIQYQIQAEDERVMIFTANTNSDLKFQKMSDEFDDIMEGLELK